MISALYALPFGKGKSCGSSLGGFANGAVSGWSVNSIVTLQEGFPITPQLSYNPSNNGDTKDPVRPFLNPDFTGPVILGKPGQWFNPNAFIAPPSTSGFYGNLGRDTFAGPGARDVGFLRAERYPSSRAPAPAVSSRNFQSARPGNFNTPNLIVFTPHTAANPTGLSGTAGAITSTSTTSRQVQFGLKLLW